MVLKHLITIVISFNFHLPFQIHLFTILIPPNKLPTIFTTAMYLPFIAQMDFKWYIVEPFFLEMDKKWTSIVIFLTTKPFIFHLFSQPFIWK
jgi:hypothetical protein